jgi:hypothetical protein
VKASDEKILADVVYRSRIKDWLHGVRQIQPNHDAAQALADEPLTNAEKHRQIYQMIVATREEGGAGITPQHGEWKAVEAVFPLHDHVRNKKWLTEFSSKTFLTPEDLDEVRDNVGEKVYYSSYKVEQTQLTLARLVSTTPSYSPTSLSWSSLLPSASPAGSYLAISPQFMPLAMAYGVSCSSNTGNVKNENWP